MIGLQGIGGRPGQAVTTIEPVAEVDQFAAFTAEGTPAILRVESTGLAAGRATADPRRPVHSAQDWTANGMSTVSC